MLEGFNGVAMAVEPTLSIRWKPSQDTRKDGVLLIRGDSKMALWDWQTPLAQQKDIPPFFTKTIRLLSSFFSHERFAQKQIAQGGELLIERRWPIEWGLGSSSAIAACIIELFAPQKERLEKWSLGHKMLLDTQGKASGLDLAAQLRGSFVRVFQNQPRPLVNIKLPDEIYFVHANEKADTAELVQEKPLTQDQLKRLGQSTEDFLKNQDWLKALKEHAAILSETILWPASIAQARKEWIANNCVQEMKSCGAGGGDTWMIWCEDPSKLTLIKENCQQRGWTLKKYNPYEKGVCYDVC